MKKVTRKEIEEQIRSVGSSINLAGQDLSDLDLSYLNLQNANLSNTELLGANLIGTNLSHANLSGTDLTEAVLEEAILQHTNLSEVDCIKSDLSGIDLSTVNLYRANLHKTDLSGCNLRFANLSECDLQMCDLGGADLSNANLSKTKVAGVSFDEHTKWPANFDPIPAQVYQQKKQNVISDMDDSVATLKSHFKEVSSVAVSPDGQTIASASLDKTVRLWDFASRKPLKVLKGHVLGVETICFSPNGKYLASGDSRSIVKVWDLNDALVTFKAHLDSWPEGYLPPPEGLDVLSGSGIWSVVFSLDSQRIFCGGAGRGIETWQIGDLQGLTMFVKELNHVEVLALHPDNNFLVSGNSEGIKFWQIENEQLFFTLTTEAVYDLAFSPDGKIIASSNYSSVKLWEVATGSLLLTLSNCSGPVEFSPNGQYLAINGKENTIKIWNLQNSEELTILKGHNNRISSLAFTPDSSHLISGSWDKTVKIWKL